MKTFVNNAIVFCALVFLSFVIVLITYVGAVIIGDYLAKGPDCDAPVIATAGVACTPPHRLYIVGPMGLCRCDVLEAPSADWTAPDVH